MDGTVIRTPLLLTLLTLSPSLAAETVDVMSHGWHTGIVLPVNARTTELIPAFRNFQQYRWAEVSWGDEGFFRAKSISPGVTLRALFWPTPTVLLIDGFRSPSTAEYNDGTVLRLELPDREFRELCLSIAADFAETKPLSVGVYDSSLFFRAHGKYTVARTCNVWTLEKLRDAGLETTPRLGLRAEVAMRQIVDQASVIRPPNREPKWPYTIATLAGLAIALRKRRARKALEDPPRDRHLRRAWGVVGVATLTMFLATILVANNLDGARLFVRAGLVAFTGGLATVIIVSGERLRTRDRPLRTRHGLDLLQCLFAALVIIVVLSPM